MDIVDRTEQSRFVGTEDGHEAELVYRDHGDRLVIESTEMPEALRGQGLGGHLVTAAVDRAEASGQTLVPECPYARHWLGKHDDVADRVEIDWPAED